MKNTATIATCHLVVLGAYVCTLSHMLLGPACCGVGGDLPCAQPASAAPELPQTSCWARAGLTTASTGRGTGKLSAGLALGGQRCQGKRERTAGKGCWGTWSRAAAEGASPSVCCCSRAGGLSTELPRSAAATHGCAVLCWQGPPCPLPARQDPAPLSVPPPGGITVSPSTSGRWGKARVGSILQSQGTLQQPDLLWADRA